MLQDSVYPWLKDISVDEDFVDELRSVLRHVTAGVYRRVVKTDWSPFILTDLIREGVRHVHYFLEARAKSVNAHNNNPPSSFLSSPSPSRACGAGAQVPIFVNSSPARDVQLTALSCLGSYMHVAGKRKHIFGLAHTSNSSFLHLKLNSHVTLLSHSSIASIFFIVPRYEKK